MLQDGDVDCSIASGLLHNTVASNCKPNINDEDTQTRMVIIHCVCVVCVCASEESTDRSCSKESVMYIVCVCIYL